MDFFEHRRERIMGWRGWNRPPAPPHLFGEKVVVVGLERSGLAACRFLSVRGAAVTGTDVRNESELPAIQELKGMGVTPSLGGHDPGILKGASIVVVSPGVPCNIPFLKEAAGRGVRVISEVELASLFIDFPFISITGTNGKSTVTEFTSLILGHSGFRVFKGGNVGTAAICGAGLDFDIGVIEISSFQMELVEHFHPHIATILNIGEDHLDRHPSFEEYRGLKVRSLMGQTAEDFVILNLDDGGSMSASGASRAREFHFSAKGGVEEGIFLQEGGMEYRIEGERGRISLARFRPWGRQNMENLLASTLISLLAGSSPHEVESALPHLQGLPHRLEFCGERGGVRFYNDSKATNVSSVKGDLENFEKGVILIAGGRDKGADFTPLREAMKGRVSHLLLIGEAAQRMARELEGVCPMIMEADMRSAVLRAWSLASGGDEILLSPACSSFDMFRDYEERGEAFRSAVGEILKGDG